MASVVKNIAIFTLPLLLFGCSTSPLHIAAKNGDTQQLVGLLDKGVNINEKFGMENATALFFAAQAGQTDVVQILLQRGADPNISSSGLTPLEQASIENRVEIVSLLLENGARVNPEAVKMLPHRTHPQIRQLLQNALITRYRALPPLRLTH